MQPEDKLIKERKEKLELLRKKKILPYAYVFDKKNYSQDILNKFSKLKKGGKTKTKVVVSGRIVSLRTMGKVSFGHIQDREGKIQFYLREDQIGKEAYNSFNKLYDVGDIIGIEGLVFRTKMGEVSIKVKKIKLLTKSLRPLPSKWYGLKDKEIRYRQRYIDLIVNPKVKEIFIARGKIIQAIREFMKKEDFVEVETPILQPIYGGATARPFKSKLNALNMDVYMRISNELYLKRLIVGGYEKIFEFSYDFRNEGIDKSHNPEFVQVETMWAYADYKKNMKFCEDIFKFIAKKVFGKTTITLKRNKVNFAKWKRISFSDVVKKYTKIDFNKVGSLSEAKKAAKKLGIDVKKCDNIGEVFIELFEQKAQPKLIQPTIVFDYPRDAYGLAKENRKDPRFSEAFEFFINGLELGLSYSEQNDPEELLNWWKKAEKYFKKGEEEAQRLDKDFIRALEIGMPPTSGIGIGIDRVTMLLTNSDSLRDVILFPFMRPENK